MTGINNITNPFKYTDSSGKIKNIDEKYQKRTKIAATVGGIITLGIAAAPILYGMSAYYRSKCRRNLNDEPGETAERIEDLQPNKIISGAKSSSKTEAAPVISPKKLPTPPNAQSMLSSLKQAIPENVARHLEKLFMQDSEDTLNPEDWAEIMPYIQQHLKENPKNQKIWERLIEQKLDPNVESISIPTSNSTQNLSKSLLISQSETFKNMFSDASSDQVVIDFPDWVSEKTKNEFLLILKNGLKGKPLDTSDLKKVIELHRIADFYDVKWLQNELRSYLKENFVENMSVLNHKLDYLSDSEKVEKIIYALDLIDASIGQNFESEGGLSSLKDQFSSYMLQIAKDYASKEVSPDNERILVLIRQYGKKNHLVDLQLAATPGLGISKEYHTKQAKLLFEVLKNNPDFKLKHSCTFDIDPEIEELVNPEDITTILQAGFSSLSVNGTKENKALTSEGLKAIADGIKNTTSLISLSLSGKINEETATSLASAIRSNDRLSVLNLLPSEFENRAAFDLIFNAVVTHPNLSIIVMKYRAPDDFSGDSIAIEQDKESLKSQRKGLIIV